ncbi:hypothetical protein [Caloramator quimbayensis]|uniref:hypothetical protein n=1 Tax=Caloramator quimbayensis TaxID=1147123 RepID=UPI00099AC858|nr:hypothetical protein [Caloramator quimbayensis]
MKIDGIIKLQQSDVYKKLNDKNYAKKRKQSNNQDKKKEHLSFYDLKNLMEDAPVYKRGKGGAYKQIR